jgi:hypothetical protein
VARAKPSPARKKYRTPSHPLYCATRSATKEAALWEQWANTPLDADKNDPNG